MTHNPYFDRRPRQEEPEEPIEWQTDKNGKRFRKIGNMIEYEMEINGVPESVFHASMKRQKVLDEERRKREAEENAERQTHRNCPFKIGRNMIHNDCEKSCVFYQGDGCVIASAPTEPTTDTNGKPCPIAGRCNDKCAMYSGGCKTIEFFKCMKHGKE